MFVVVVFSLSLMTSTGHHGADEAVLDVSHQLVQDAAIDGAGDVVPNMSLDTLPVILRDHVVQSSTGEQWVFRLTGYEFHVYAVDEGLAHFKGRNFQLAMSRMKQLASDQSSHLVHPELPAMVLPKVLREHVVFVPAVNGDLQWQFKLTGFCFSPSSVHLGLLHFRGREFQETCSEMAAGILPKVFREHVVSAPAPNGEVHWKFNLTGFCFSPSTVYLGLQHLRSKTFQEALRRRADIDANDTVSKYRRLGLSPKCLAHLTNIAASSTEPRVRSLLERICRMRRSEQLEQSERVLLDRLLDLQSGSIA